MVDAAAAEQFLDANPQFAKRYYDSHFRPKVISELLDNNRKAAVDVSRFHELTTVEESEVLFDLVRDIQDNLNMEKCVFNLMRHLSFMIRADRTRLFMFRQRNGVAELATRCCSLGAGRRRVLLLISALLADYLTCIKTQSSTTAWCRPRARSCTRWTSASSATWPPARRW